MERWQEAYLFERGATPLVVAILFTDSDLIAHAIYTFGEPTPLEFMNTFVNALLQHLSTQTFLFHEVVDVKILFGCERSAANASFPCSNFTRNLIFEASVHKLCPHLGDVLCVWRARPRACGWPGGGQARFGAVWGPKAR